MKKKVLLCIILVILCGCVFCGYQFGLNFEIYDNVLHVFDDCILIDRSDIHNISNSAHLSYYINEQKQIAYKVYRSPIYYLGPNASIIETLRNGNQYSIERIKLSAEQIEKIKGYFSEIEKEEMYKELNRISDEEGKLISFYSVFLGKEKEELAYYIYDVEGVEYLKKVFNE